MRSLLLSSLAFVLFGAILATPSALAVVHHVTIVDFAFDPDTSRIAAGDTVRWTVEATFQHTVTSGVNCTQNGLFDSGFLSNGQTYQRVFLQQGDFPYFCIPHCPPMDAIVLVGPGTAVEPNSWGRIRSLYR